MPTPQSAKAVLFDGHYDPDDGWRPITYFFYGVSTLMLLTGSFFYPEERDFRVWAEKEARARLELKEKAGFTDFEFGKHYNIYPNKYDFEALRAAREDDNDAEEEE